MSVINLESICARYGWDIASAEGLKKYSNKENIITKALGVLAENGFYAMHVFLLSCNQPKEGGNNTDKDMDAQKNPYCKAVQDILHDMLYNRDLALLPQNLNKRGVGSLESVRKITEDLPRLILARRVTEQALTFARYHCKAMDKAEQPKENS